MSDAPSLRIVRLANFVTPSSGGLRTALRELGAGYQAAGHESILIVPGERDADEHTRQGRVITLPGHSVPGTGGYRVLTDRRRLARLLDGLAPDRLEVSDRGLGIKRQNMPHIFEPFFTSNDEAQGAGLGLAIARELAERMHGELTVRSVPGRTTFSLELPS